MRKWLVTTPGNWRSTWHLMPGDRVGAPHFVSRFNGYMDKLPYGMVRVVVDSALVAVTVVLLIITEATPAGAAAGAGQHIIPVVNSLLLRGPDAVQSGAQAWTLNASLNRPWGMAFLPNGRILVTQKTGSMVILSANGATVQATVSGLPAVASDGQGGLLDVAPDPDFIVDPWVYWSYSEPGSGAEAGLAGTAVARGRLVGNTLRNVEVIYRQVPKVPGSGHYGSRLVFRRDKTLYVTLGERQKQIPAQDLATSLGKVIRINRDGTVPPDNPRIAGALPEIWSYGHRNPQGAAIRPGTDTLWLHEHGPQGGDEVNRIEPGGNYGWPLVSYGCDYGDPVGTACQIGGGTHAPDYIEPVTYWIPVSIAPAGMIFYSGSRFPRWRNDIFLGALAGKALWRIKLAGDTVVEREKMFSILGDRIRDVEQGPDGYIYLLTDSGKLIQVRN